MIEETINLKLEVGTFVSVKNINIGDRVEVRKNNINIFAEVTNKNLSDTDQGFKIKTKSSEIILGSNCKIWSEAPDWQNKFYVYLMYRKDLGFRIGKTNKWKAKTNRFGHRAIREQADRMWIIDIVDSNEEAIYLEECYSLEFGIPTAVFNAEERDLNQERINRIFEKFGNNGWKLLENKNLSFNYSHWSARGSSTSEHTRLVTRVVAHSKYRTRVGLEFSDEKLKTLFENSDIKLSSYKPQRKQNDKEHFLVEKYLVNYYDAVNFANKIKNLTNCSITNIMACSRESNFKLLMSGNLHIGMKVLSSQNNSIVPDEIVSIEKVQGKFYNIEINSVGNLFANTILVHDHSNF